MCGIVGYIGNKDSTTILIDGLKKLEYRGYDSAGIAVFESGEIKVIKSKGRLSEIENKLDSIGKPNGICGIGHTRWATHGEPSDVNSHPHSSARVSIVHNGIIENYLQIKEFLLSHGYQFDSQTDTETVAKLLDFNYSNDPIDAIIETVKRLKGSYALGILFKDYPETVFAVRKESPLIVGVGKGENFIASDIPAILKYTKNYYLLEENEIAILNKDSVKIIDLDHAPIEKILQTATWDIDAAEKNGYPHFMLKEINEQPKAIKDTISSRIDENWLPDFSDPRLTDKLFQNTKKIHIVACGTAMHAGMVGKYIIEKMARIPVEVDIASEFRYRNPILNKEDLVVIISQSGETADTLAAMRLAKTYGVFTLAVVNVVGSSIAREADSVIYTWAGPEVSVASTKAYSVQLSVMYLLAIRFALSKKQIDAKNASKLTKTLTLIPDLISEILKSSDDCKYFSSIFINAKDLFFIGRGLDYALSMEGSLKLKEISYIHSEAYAAGELKHGTISLIEQDTPVLALITQKSLSEKMVSNIKEVKARGAKVLAFTQLKKELLADSCDYIINLPEIDDIFMPMIATIPLQLFAYYSAVLRGCDVDKPRNLAKSVTVE